MPWVYEQRTGRLLDPDEIIVAVGYSGHDAHRNRPEDEHLIGLGPIPRGLYLMGEEYDSDTRGPVCIPLTPKWHDAHGRNGFLIHGDSRTHPGEASHGCIVLTRGVREMLADHADELLEVIEGYIYRKWM